MGQMVFELPKASKSPSAQKYITEGFHANQHCEGRGDCPYDSGMRAEWWDQGWCEAELCDLSEPARTELEIWLAGGNE